MLKTKESEQEKAKIDLFNILYGTSFKSMRDIEYPNDLPIEEIFAWNGITLAEHLDGTDLSKLIEDKPEIYCNVRRISPNGMNRDISFYVIVDNRLRDITYFMSWIIEGREPKQNKYMDYIIRVSGAGMDMCFHTVYTLSNILFRGLNDSKENGYNLDYKTI